MKILKSLAIIGTISSIGGGAVAFVILNNAKTRKPRNAYEVTSETYEEFYAERSEILRQRLITLKTEREDISTLLQKMFGSAKVAFVLDDSTNNGIGSEEDQRKSSLATFCKDENKKKSINKPQLIKDIC